MANIQRMLRPLANKIVGGAVNVVGRSKTMSPKFNIARGLRRRGPKTMMGAIGKMTNEQKREYGIIKHDTCKELALIMKKALLNTQDIQKRKHSFLIRAMKSFISPGKLKVGSKSGRKIISAPSQWKRRMGLILGTSAGAGTAGGVIGYRSGKKKGSREGYVRALEDVVGAAKSISNNFEKRVEALQRAGVTLGQLRKQYAVTGVVGPALVREDLQPSKKNSLQKVEGYVPATSSPIGITSKPPEQGSKLNNVRYNKKPKIKYKMTPNKPSYNPKETLTPRHAMNTGSPGTQQFTGFSTESRLSR